MLSTGRLICLMLSESQSAILAWGLQAGLPFEASCSLLCLHGGVFLLNYPFGCSIIYLFFCFIAAFLFLERVHGKEPSLPVLQSWPSCFSCLAWNLSASWFRNPSVDTCQMASDCLLAQFIIPCHVVPLMPLIEHHAWWLDMHLLFWSRYNGLIYCRIRVPSKALSLHKVFCWK